MIYHINHFLAGALNPFTTFINTPGKTLAIINLIVHLLDSYVPDSYKDYKKKKKNHTSP